MNRRRKLPADPAQSAVLAGLRYEPDGDNGIRRRRAGRGWIFTKHDGTRVTNTQEIRRIQALAIPPAWTRVWIAPQASCHLQAVGYDARGRKQYRYHAAFRQLRDSTKFERILEFAAALPKIRHLVALHLRDEGLTRRKVLAAIVRLLDLTSIRVGNSEYAKSNHSFGLTTLVDEHVTFDKSKMSLCFNGKSGVEHCVDIYDKRLARIVRECQEIPGQELFQYLDGEGGGHRIRSEDVNAYIREISGGEFTAKDFRTWNGTRAGLVALRGLGVPQSATEAKAGAVSAVKEVAAMLRNRPATCRKFYVHPAVLEAYADGVDLVSLVAGRRKPRPGLTRDEQIVVAVIAKWRGAKAAGN